MGLSANPPEMLPLNLYVISPDVSVVFREGLADKPMKGLLPYRPVGWEQPRSGSKVHIAFDDKDD